MIPILHHYDPSKQYATFQPASLRDRVIAQLIDGIILGVVCSLLFVAFSNGRIYSAWVAPILPQFLLEVSRGFQTDAAYFWWGGYFFSIHLPYGKNIFLHYPAPLLWLVYGLYYFLFTSRGGQTPGKMLKRLVVLQDPHSAPSPGKALLRWMAYYLSLFPLGLGFWWKGFSKDGKTWHDKLCKTQVYHFG